MTNIKDKILKDNIDLKTIKDKNEHQKVVFLKTIRLTSALYLISNFLSDNEPLKRELRDKALNLLAAVHEYNVTNCISHIGHIIALLDVAMSGPFVSVMNFSLVKTEYLGLRQVIFTEQARETAASLLDPVKPEEMVSRAFLDRPVAETLKSQDFPSEIDRRQVIIDFIKSHGWSSIRDIAGIIPNFSNKTVQRELQNLVRDGVLKKTGDRRWSRYQLAKTA